MAKSQLTPDQRAAVLVEMSKGVRLADIGDKFKVSKSTLIRISNKFKREQTTKRKTYFRHGAMGPERSGMLENYVNRYPYDTLREIKENLNLPVSKSTISRRLIEKDLKSMVSPKKFLISHANTEERLRVALMRKYWTKTYLENIIFTDESGMDNSGLQKRRVRRPKNSRNDPNFTYRFPNKTLRVSYFSWISIFGVGEIYFYKTMDSEMYCNIMEEMINKMKELFGHDEFRIVHDNARFSHSTYTMKFMKDKNYDKYFIAHPVYSPDMNLIENAWGLLKQKVRDDCFRNGQTRRRVDFEKLIDEYWKSLTLDYVKSLYDSYPRRMDEIVKVRGNLTKY